MTKPKIYIVSPTESVITERGKRHPNLAMHLLENNFDIHYITSSFNHSAKRVFREDELDAVKKNTAYPIQFLSCGLYKRNISLDRLFWNIKFAFLLYRFLRKKLTSNDILLLPSRPPEILFACAKLKKRTNCKLFLDIEDIWPDAFLIKNKFLKNSFYGYCNFLNKRSIPAIHSGVHVSPNFVEWQKRYQPNYISTFAPLGISNAENCPTNKKYYSSEIQTLNLFYGGTLTLQFDILPVLKAMKMSTKKITITLAGDNGKGERFQSVISFLDENNLTYKNLGILEKQTFLAELGKADVAILPMISGGLPKKFFDAMGSFKPILSLGKGGVMEQVLQKNLGWVSDFSEHEIKVLLESIDASSLNEKIKNIESNYNQFLEIESMQTIQSQLEKMY